MGTTGGSHTACHSLKWPHNGDRQVICIIPSRQYIELNKMLIFNTFIECCQSPCLILQDVQEDVQEMDVQAPQPVDDLPAPQQNQASDFNTLSWTRC
jgi:hypothetical protein